MASAEKPKATTRKTGPKMKAGRGTLKAGAPGEEGAQPVAVIITPAVLAPRAKPTIDREAANELHLRIRGGAKRLATDFAMIARDLQVVREAQAWAYFAPTWSDYLADFREFSRSYMFSLAKLGQAGFDTIEKLVSMGIGGTQLIEYARLAPSASKIEDLVDQTWGEVSGLPVREMAKTVRDKVAALYPKTEARGKTKVIRRPSRKAVKAKMRKLYASWSEDERAAMFEVAMEATAAQP